MFQTSIRCNNGASAWVSVLAKDPQRDALSATCGEKDRLPQLRSCDSAAVRYARTFTTPITSSDEGTGAQH